MSAEQVERLGMRVATDVAAVAGVRIDALRGQKRRAFAARWACFFLTRELTGAAYEAIGQVFEVSGTAVRKAMTRCRETPESWAIVETILRAAGRPEELAA